MNVGLGIAIATLRSWRPGNPHLIAPLDLLAYLQSSSLQHMAVKRNQPVSVPYQNIVWQRPIRPIHRNHRTVTNRVDRRAAGRKEIQPKMQTLAPAIERPPLAVGPPGIAVPLAQKPTGRAGWPRIRQAKWRGLSLNHLLRLPGSFQAQRQPGPAHQP